MAVNKVSIAVAKGEVLGLQGKWCWKVYVGNSVINLLEPPGYISEGKIFDGTTDQLSNEEM